MTKALQSSLAHIDTLPQGDFDEIIEKYVEMNIAHPFRLSVSRLLLVAFLKN
jgi:fido (protein-threonine AMPylation protein)